MNNGASFVNVDLLPNEQHTNIEIEHEKNPTCNQPNSEEIKEDINKTKNYSTTSTLLQRSCCSRHQTTTAMSASALFISLAITIGVLVICLTSPKPKAPKCMIMLIPTVEYSNRDSSHPQSLAIGDFNNDSLMDIIVANSETDNVGIFLGNGNSTFASQMTYSTGLGSVPHMVAVDDFNHDNRLDIAVANFGSNNIGIFLGNGDGSFKNQTIIETASSRPLYIVLDDFNNDKQLDIVFAGYGTNSIGIVLGFGNGNFTKQTTFSTGYDSLPYSITVGDFNKDNKLDIAVSNFGTSEIGIFLGHGNGTFAIQTTYTAGANTHPYSIAISDLNNDTQLDIAVVNSATDNLCVLFGFGNGSFTLPTFYSTGSNSNPISIIIADFNKDNKPDIAIANNGTNSMGVLFGYGNGSFTNQITYLTSPNSSPYSIIVADFNNDSQLDIAIVNQQSNNVMIFNGYRKEMFANQITYATNTTSSSVGMPFYPTGVDSYPTSVAIGDFNNDSRLDIVVVNYGQDNVGILLGYGDGTFSSQTTYSTGDSSGPMAVAIGDFNNDGRLDIAVANYDMSNVGILFGHSDGDFSSQIVYPTGVDSYPTSVAIGDFNNDSRLDIVVVNYGQDNVGILLGYGDGTFSSQTTYSTGDSSGPMAVAIGDFNNDGRLDIAVANYDMSNVGILFGYGDGTFRDQMTFSSGVFSYPLTVTVADFNNDSSLDIAVGNSASLEEHVLILLGNGNGSFSPKGKYSTGLNSNPSSIVVGHFNNDSLLDIAVVNRDTNNLGIFLGYGDGTFSNQITYPTSDGSQPISIAIGDFNDDNQTDVVVANCRTSTIGIFLAFSNTIFEKTTTSSTRSAAHPQAIAIGDFTNNGQLDVAVASYATHSIDVLFNYGNGSFVMQTVYSGDFTFYPVSIVVTDFNNDSRLDIAVANSIADNVDVIFGEENGTFGNHTTYSTGISSNPQSVAIGDFNNDSRPDIVVAHSGIGSVGVLLRADNAAMESVKTFSTGSGSKPHALAVGDFDSDGILDITVANNGNGNIGFFFGFGNGTFPSQSIISLGEASYPLWVGIGDFNNDKRLDVVVITNVWPAPVIVLLGDGNGSFRMKKTNNVLYAISGAVSDFNSDGLLDLALTHPFGYVVAILLGYGDGTFEIQITYSIGIPGNSQSIVVGDFNNDGQIDIAIAHRNMDNVGVLLGYGNGTFRDQMIYSTGGSTPESVTVGDFNNDSQLDIVVANAGTNNIAILFGYGNGIFSSPTMYSTGNGSSPYCVTIGDFNKDDRLDIAVVYYGTGNLGILLGYVNGTFFNEITYITGENSIAQSVAVGDFNNDGRLDIAFTDIKGENIGVFLGYVSESFISTTTYPIGKSSRPVSIAVGDFNNDTHLDAAVADRKTNKVIILYGSGYGTFSGQANYSMGNGSYPNSIAVGDFNEDHQLDIAIVNSGTSNIAILLGYGNGTFSNPTLYSTGDLSSPLSLAVGHFDNDIHLDIAVAIFGSNEVGLLLGYGNGSFANPLSFTSGFGSHPYAVAFGDLNKDNSGDIVVCNNGYSTIEILSKIC